MGPDETLETQAGRDLVGEHGPTRTLECERCGFISAVTESSPAHLAKHVRAIEAEAKAQERAADQQEIEKLRRIAERWSGWAFTHDPDPGTRRSAARDFDESRGLAPAKERAQ